MLMDLHEGHPGMTKMKVLSRMYVWWPGINVDIEKFVRLCTECQEVQSSLLLHPWKWASQQWSRLHLDLAGPFQGKMFLVVIDAHSKWIEATVTSSTSSMAVIEELRTIFAKFRFPETIVTDIGTGFVSQEFEAYLRRAGIRQVISSPYHLVSNSLAERALQVVKNGLKKVRTGSVNTSSQAALHLPYHSTEHHRGFSSRTALGRRPRTRLDLLHPNTLARVENKQMEQKLRHDRKAKCWFFSVGEPIFARNFGTGHRWLSEDITEKARPVSFRVRLEDGRFRCCHQDQLRHRELRRTL